jgi:GAF domain-containing protein
MEIVEKKFKDKREMYGHITGLLAGMLRRDDEVVSSLANVSALLELFMDDINWVGFYLMKDDALALGPFQGKPAVTRIGLGDGVCGTAAMERKSQRVDDVRACDNHIACDSASSSEIVIPMIKNNSLIGVLDIDSPSISRFDDDDENGLENFVKEMIGIIYDRRSVRPCLWSLGT